MINLRKLCLCKGTQRRPARLTHDHPRRIEYHNPILLIDDPLGPPLGCLATLSTARIHPGLQDVAPRRIGNKSRRPQGELHLRTWDYLYRLKHPCP